MHRRATDFVEDYITIADGKTVVIRNGVNFGTFDNAVYRNSDLPKREYDAVDLQSGWQAAKSLTARRAVDGAAPQQRQLRRRVGQQPGASPR